MKVLITGGAGYIGSFVLRAVREAGHEAVVIDDLSMGHRSAVGDATLHTVECGDTPRVSTIMKSEGVEGVIHLAALSLVGESVREPGLYWSRNVGQAAGLLEACRAAGVKRFVLSSTAAVYGEPESVPIYEEHPSRPTNPYGATKRAIEQMLGHYNAVDELGWVALRYFNAAGASADGMIGEDHDPETHLVPLAVRAAFGQRGPLTVFGRDYDTRDGTCLRDYVHVRDLARAHVMALDWLERHPGGELIANLGAGKPTSVQQILDGIKKVSGREVPHSDGERRAGDPSVLVASIDRALTKLGWSPRESDIETILRDAILWHEKHPQGYGD